MHGQSKECVLFFGGGRGLPFQILSSSTFSHFSLVLDIASVPNFVNELILLFQVNTFLAIFIKSHSDLWIIFPCLLKGKQSHTLVSRFISCI